MEKALVHIINKSPHPLPGYQTSGSAGMDICAWLDAPVKLKSMERRLISTGLYMALPAGFEAQIRPRSGTSFKKGLTLANAVGTIDSDYRGELKISIINLSTEIQEIVDGERIAQMIIARYDQISWHEVTSLEETARGEGGFGHTG